MPASVPFLVFLLASAHLWAANRPMNVLVLAGDEPNQPSLANALTEMRAQFNKDDPTAVSLYTEYLDLARFQSADYALQVLSWLGTKYRSVPLDLIVCISRPTLQLILPARDRLWPGVPITFAIPEAGDSPALKLPPDVVGFVMRYDFEGTARLVLKLLPRTKHLAVVAGSARRDREFQREMMSVSAKLGPGLDTIDLGGLSFEDLANRLSSLPAQTAVLWTAVTEDNTGRQFVPRDALAALAPRANAPIFGPTVTYLGTGIVGGSVLDFRVLGRRAALLSQQVLYEGLRGNPARGGNSANQIQLDWRQLRKWEIPADRIPAGSLVLFRTTSLWDEHRAAILIISGFIVVQMILITLLLLEGRRLHLARRELAGLSSRLISAQDEERARIARELHDDISQRLALFVIEIDQIRENNPNSPAEPELQRLSEKAVATAADLHELAQGLHPSKLDHLGLLPAVREFCREVELRSGVDVDVITDHWPAILGKDATLCLYWIVQEALQNVVRHSHAHRANLQFVGRSHEISVIIADDGCGFDLSSVAGRGIGLAGMRERLRGVQGSVNVHSKPGTGTRLRVSIPIHEALLGTVTADADSERGA